MLRYLARARASGQIGGARSGQVGLDCRTVRPALPQAALIGTRDRRCCDCPAALLTRTSPLLLTPLA